MLRPGVANANGNHGEKEKYNKQLARNAKIRLIVTSSISTRHDLAHRLDERSSTISRYKGLSRLETFPFTENTPPGNTVGEDESAPGPALPDLDHRLPHTAISGGIRRIAADHMICLASEPEDLARWRLDCQLGRFFPPG